jgi:predicted transcriptional regulator
VWLDQKQYQALGTTLLAAREPAVLKQTELAKRLRKPQSFISSYENGERRTDVLEFIRVAEKLDCDPAKRFSDVLASVQGRRHRK